MAFKRLSDLELQDLDDEELVAYLVDARDAGENGEVKTAMQILVYGRMDLVQAIVARSVPEHAVDRVAQEAMIHTMTAVFDGRSVGQFINLLKSVTRFKVADYWKALGRHGREETTLDTDDEEGGRRREVVDPAEEVGAVPLQTVIDDLLETFAPVHRAVIELAIFGDLPSADVVDEVNRLFPHLDDPMTVSNVDQIKSRFRKALRDELDESDTS